MFVGDIHGDFGKLNSLMNTKFPDITIVCGDIAYFWMNNQAIGKIKPKGKVYLVPGNHEDFMMINDIVGRNKLEPVEVEPNLFFCSIGSSITVNNQKILFVGGADSFDKQQRTMMVDWFPEETLNCIDIDFILDNHSNADIIVSHTAPTEFWVGNAHWNSKHTDPTRKALSVLLEKYHPSRWYFGHFHEYFIDVYKNTRWKGLNLIQAHTKYFDIIDI